MEATAHARTEAVDQSKAKTITGWVLGLLPCLLLIFSAVMKIVQPQGFAENWTKSGYPMNTAVPIGIAEIACAVLYLIPKTRYFGAIMMAGYLGGAVATHVRAGEPQFVVPILVGVVAWIGLWLRDPRFRELAPLVK